MSNTPGMQRFWEDYERMMHATFENTQKMINNMGAYIGSNQEAAGPDLNAFTQEWQGIAKPKINVDDSSVTVLFTVNQYIDQSNTKIYLEGCFLIVEGVIQARVPLPTAVRKYGGRAVARQAALEIVLPRDKYCSRQLIPLEKA